ncbi:MAG: KdsC family phosphatase [Longimicrobiales bacterium]
MTESEAQGLDADLARAVRLVVLDVDGVLTDGGVYVGVTASREAVELKRFDIQDGLGVKMLLWAGIEVALVSGRVSESTSIRAAEMGVTECHQDAGAEKLPIVHDLLERKGLAWTDVAMVADDLADLPVFLRAGLRVAVANAVPEVTRVAHWCTKSSGGEGAVREFSRALLSARGEWERLVDEYMEQRTND